MTGTSASDSRNLDTAPGNGGTDGFSRHVTSASTFTNVSNLCAFLDPWTRRDYIAELESRACERQTKPSSEISLCIFFLINTAILLQV